MKVVTRFAPSPTGYMHIGNLRTAVFNFLIAQQNDGEFILRLDDTDKLRSKQKYIDQIQRDMEWLGLYWDRVEKQSDRIERYQQVAFELKEKNRLYPCFEAASELDLKRKKQLNMGKPPIYDRSALRLSNDEIQKLRDSNLDEYWRFKLEENRISWLDTILGETSIDAGSVSDPVLIRKDGQFLYTLASVCDDIDFGITHVVRGSDHVTNTATQVQLIELLGSKVPQFSHHSLLTSISGETLSKRHGALSLKDMREEGIEPLALLSMMAFLGSSKSVHSFSNIDSIKSNFTLDSFGSTPTKFDLEALNRLSQKMLRGFSFFEISSDIKQLGVPDEIAEKFWEIVKDNVLNRSDLQFWWRICSDEIVPDIDQADLLFVEKAMSVIPVLPHGPETWSEWTKNVSLLTGRKGRSLFNPLRKAVTGVDHGPDMSKLLPLIGFKAKN